MKYLVSVFILIIFSCKKEAVLKSDAGLIINAPVHISYGKITYPDGSIFKEWHNIRDTIKENITPDKNDFYTLYFITKRDTTGGTVPPLFTIEIWSGENNISRHITYVPSQDSLTSVLNEKVVF